MKTAAVSYCGSTDLSLTYLASIFTSKINYHGSTQPLRLSPHYQMCYHAGVTSLNYRIHNEILTPIVKYTNEKGLCMCINLTHSQCMLCSDVQHMYCRDDEETKH